MSDYFIKVATPLVGEEEIEAVREVLLSGNFVSGKKVAEFEDKFAEYIGTDYAVAVNSGTSAIYIALEAMGVKANDEVIVPPMTFFATISAVLYLGAKPVFADIDLDDLCLSPESVETVITNKTKAIIPVHLYGASAKMDKLQLIADKYRINILEDCAQAHGTEYKQKKVGSIGKAGTFSFFATKHMTTGEGGMITTDDPDIADICRCIRNHGMSGRDEHVRLGFNSRMTEMEAAMGLVQLKKMDLMNKKRIENTEYIVERIKPISWIITPEVSENVTHTYFWCPIMIDENKTKKDIEHLKSYLQENKIGFRDRYKEPLYRQRVLKELKLDYSDIFLKNAEELSGKIIGLPNHPDLNIKELDRIVNVIQSF